MTGDWRARAACLDEPDADGTFFPISDVGEKRAPTVAYARTYYCGRCPVILQCAERALDPQIKFGIWAGMDLGDGGDATRQNGKQALRSLVARLRPAERSEVAS